ncbi:MAG: hypothetical protein M1833_000324 [Piccolia ochrophora]|nr:MAG: hypothetical protein M1833_000324 [Piccolia ochrophora]
MTSSPPSSAVLVHSYRRLYRALLQAVQYSAPARFTARTKLRHAFRAGVAASYDQRRIDKTLQFLQQAAKERGIEHRIVKNLLHVSWWEDQQIQRRHIPLQRQPYAQFKLTIKMLNESEGLCLC